MSGQTNNTLCLYRLTCARSFILNSMDHWIVRIIEEGSPCYPMTGRQTNTLCIIDLATDFIVIRFVKCATYRTHNLIHQNIIWKFVLSSTVGGTVGSVIDRLVSLAKNLRSNSGLLLPISCNDNKAVVRRMPFRSWFKFHYHELHKTIYEAQNMIRKLAQYRVLCFVLENVLKKVHSVDGTCMY